MGSTQFYSSKCNRMGSLVFITKNNNPFGLLLSTLMQQHFVVVCSKMQLCAMEKGISFCSFRFITVQFLWKSICSCIFEKEETTKLFFFFSGTILFLQYNNHLLREMNTFSCFQCPLEPFSFRSSNTLTFACFCLISVLRLTWWKLNIIWYPHSDINKYNCIRNARMVYCYNSRYVIWTIICFHF